MRAIITELLTKEWYAYVLITEIIWNQVALYMSLSSRILINVKIHILCIKLSVTIDVDKWHSFIRITGYYSCSKNETLRNNTSLLKDHCFVFLAQTPQYVIAAFEFLINCSPMTENFKRQALPIIAGTPSWRGLKIAHNGSFCDMKHLFFPSHVFVSDQDLKKWPFNFLAKALVCKNFKFSPSWRC